MLINVSIKLNILSGWSYGTMCPAPRTIAYINDKANQGAVKQSKQNRRKRDHIKTKGTLFHVTSKGAWKGIAR